MLKLRTKILLLAIWISGIGIGVLSGLADGAYSAFCLFVLPVLVALAGASIVYDFNHPPVIKQVAPRIVKTPARLNAKAVVRTKHA
jgi:hypothetical protein